MKLETKINQTVPPQVTEIFEKIRKRREECKKQTTTEEMRNKIYLMPRRELACFCFNWLSVFSRGETFLKIIEDYPGITHIPLNQNFAIDKYGNLFVKKEDRTIAISHWCELHINVHNINGHNLAKSIDLLEVAGGEINEGDVIYHLVMSLIGISPIGDNIWDNIASFLKKKFL